MTPTTQAGATSAEDTKTSRGLAAFAREIIEYAFDGADADGASIQELAVSHGLLRRTTYDPKRHGPSFAETGDEWFEYTDALADTPPFGRAAEGIAVDIQTMNLSDGRVDYFVRIKCGDREVTPYVFRERYKAEYEAAHFAWIFGLRADAPDLMVYDEASHPSAPTPPASAGDVPDGWKLVPIELTDRMLEDGGQCLPPTSTLSYCYACFRDAWAAAINASPPPPATPTRADAGAEGRR